MDIPSASFMTGWSMPQPSKPKTAEHPMKK